MSLPNRELKRPSGLPISVDELYGIMRLRAFNSSAFPVNVLAENDGTVRGQVILYDGTAQQRARSETNGSLITSLYGKAGSTLTALAVETTGEQKVTNYGKDGTATIRAVSTEVTGEQRIVNFGKDSGGNIDAIRTNDNLQLFYELYEHWKIVDPYLMTDADAVAYNPGAASTEVYSVIITLYNLTAGAVNATVYVDVAAGGTVGNAEYLANAESLAAKTRLTLPELIIGGDDDIRAFASAVDSINMHFQVKQIART